MRFLRQWWHWMRCKTRHMVRPAQILEARLPHQFLHVITNAWPFKEEEENNFSSSFPLFILNLHLLLEVGLHFPHILAMAENCFFYPVLVTMCWVFPKHEMNWLLFICICLNCPFVNENEETSHLMYFVFHFGFYFGGGS
jgi:hypothetical protein